MYPESVSKKSSTTFVVVVGIVVVVDIVVEVDVVVEVGIVVVVVDVVDVDVVDGACCLTFDG